MNLLVEVLFELLRRFLRGSVLGSLILFAGFNFLGCVSVPREAPVSFKVGEAPWEKQAEPDDADRFLADLEAETKRKEIEEAKQGLAYLEGLAAGLKAADANERERTRVQKLEEVKIHLAVAEKLRDCLAVFKAGRNSFPNAETAHECGVALERSKDGERWIKANEDLWSETANTKGAE